MTATNHALTGALIGFIVINPFLAIPFAAASHFICDAIPHYGMGADAIKTSKFRRLLALDAALCVVLVVALAILQPQLWLLAAVCAFAATSPDLMWIAKFRRAQEDITPSSQPPRLLRFHAAIQWFEKPSGAAVEAAWAVGSLILLKVFIV